MLKNKSVAVLALTVLFGTMTLITETASAQAPVIYPAKGQTAEQQEKDNFECYSWAKKQTGYDPAQQQALATQPSQTQKGGALRGAARGAAGGAVGGAIAGDAGKGAQIGAGIGAVGGAAKKRRAENEQQQAAEQQQSAATQKIDTYNRSFGACMEGRGYTVK